MLLVTMIENVISYKKLKSYWKIKVQNKVELMDLEEQKNVT